MTRLNADSILYTAIEILETDATNQKFRGKHRDLWEDCKKGSSKLSMKYILHPLRCTYEENHLQMAEFLNHEESVNKSKEAIPTCPAK